MANKYGFEASTWNRYDLTDSDGKDIMDRLAALENKVATISGDDDGKLNMFPVGTVLCFATDNINATTLSSLYGGTWRLFGEGRTLVGAVWNNYTGKGYGAKMHTANTVYNPAGQSWSGGQTSTDGTTPDLIPTNDQWYTKMGAGALPLHTHTGTENAPGHWHEVRTRESYSAPGDLKPNSRKIFMDHQGESGTQTNEAFLQAPVYNSNFSNDKAHTMATDYPVRSDPDTGNIKDSDKLVKITTDAAGTADAKVGSWMPYITVWFYKRIA